MSFDRIIGQNRPLRILRGILNTGRIPTTYLFSGERGIGKFTAALEFAKALNCENLKGGDPCDRCRSCMKSGSLNHPDLKIMAPEGGMIKVEQIRELEEFLSFTPYEGNKKIVIADDADSMNAYAENAFLKTLEEPPDESVIILVSSKPDKLAGTIRSRCLNIKFMTLPENELEKASVVLGKKGIDNTSRKLSMGRVGLLFDEEVLVKRNTAYAHFEDMISGRDVTAPKDRESIDELLDYYLLFFRDMAVFLCSGKGTDLLNPDIEQNIARLCGGIELKAVMDTYVQMSDLKKKTAFNLNKSVVFNYLSALLSVMGGKR
jgi:DNA polymerase-3 subunit delta'